MLFFSKPIRIILIVLFIAFVFLLQSKWSFSSKYPLHLIKLPQGFQIHLYAVGIKNARSLTLGSKGTVFVGSRTEGKVYAVLDENKDYEADKIYTIAEGLQSPNGVAFKDGDLYVAEMTRVIRFDNIEDNLQEPVKPVVVRDGFYDDGWHGWRYLSFGPDKKLYISVGAPCNTCITDDKPYGKIMRMNADGSDLENFALGIRNSVGFDWDPLTRELWFTDNGRDELGDDLPPDELNHAPVSGLHFGFPYCHGKDISDPKFGELKACETFTPVAQALGPHVASLGMEFYTGSKFPKKYKNQIFIAEHGSWNRKKKIGYQVSLATIKDSKITGYQPFISGWKVGERVWGRPVDFLELPDGSLLVSDDFANVIYRITYQ